MPNPNPLRVCLGFPPFAAAHNLKRLNALPGVEAKALPIDEGADWVSLSPGDPIPEPPPFAMGCAAERKAILAESHIMAALHTPDRLNERAPLLRWVQGAGAGVEQFSTAGIDPEKVTLTNSSGVSAGSMSEWVIGRLLQVWKRFREADEFQREHLYERSYGRTFAGSTIGIVGLGHIGQGVASRARALGCRTLGLKRSAKRGQSSDYVDALYPLEDLHLMLSECDAVLVSAPATDETHHLIDAAALAAIPRHAVLVNVARGTLIDEVELARVMRDEPLAAAVLDVFDPEPLDPKSPLWDLPNVYISAHSSVATDRYMDDVFELFIENLERYVAGEPLKNVVDMKGLGFQAP